MFGRESVDALVNLATLPRRIPPAKPWRAAHCHAQGLPIARIARKLRVSDVAVRTYLRRKAENRERLRAEAERQARQRHEAGLGSNQHQFATSVANPLAQRGTRPHSKT